MKGDGETHGFKVEDGQRQRVQTTLAIAGILAIAAGCVYAFVARRLPRPADPPGARRAMAMFSLWWNALALNIILVGVTYLLGAAGLLTFEIQYVGSHLQRLLLAASMVGLMQYMLYLLTGRDLLPTLIVVYTLYFVVLLYSMTRQDPSAVFIGEWRTDLVFEKPDLRSVQLLSLGAILLPPVVCSILYLRLGLRVADPTGRWRVVLVSSAVLLWWAIAVVAGQRAALDDSPLQAANRLLSVLAALAVLAAYSPPAWAQRRWGITRSQSA